MGAENREFLERSDGEKMKHENKFVGLCNLFIGIYIDYSSLSFSDAVFTDGVVR